MIEIHPSDVIHICGAHQIEVLDLKSVQGSFAKRIFFINQAWLLRTSATPMTLEQEKYRRVAGLERAPKIVHTGCLQRDSGPLHYTLLTLLPGEDFVGAYPQTSAEQQRELGRDVARFLDSLHALDGPKYDLGLYVPALPQFAGTWREGHQAYWELLEQDSKHLPLNAHSRAVFERAFRFLRTAGAELDFQSGPRLLHNDFHPANILLAEGKFSGVIDWECSQYGEADFDLCHLVHWCLYPPQTGIDYRPFLGALLAASPQCARAPRLAQRLTLYQIEHELQQIVWNASQAQDWRVPRLVRWLDGAAVELFRELAA